MSLTILLAEISTIQIVSSALYVGFLGIILYSVVIYASEFIVSFTRHLYLGIRILTETSARGAAVKGPNSSLSKIRHSFPRDRDVVHSTISDLPSNEEKSRLLNSENCEPPCARVILRAERANQRNGHENMGFLSRQGGFLPLSEPLKSFPELYSAWDQLAKDMARLIADQSLRRAIDNLPILSADVEHLPDVYLHRAATFLSIAAHAYVRLDGDVLPELVKTGDQHASYPIPASIEKPWAEVSRRLGRERLFMSYVDLVVYNWQWKNGLNTTNFKAKDFSTDNLQLLLPTANNKEEHTFYLTQVELLSQATPLLENVVAAQRAVLRNDAQALGTSLQRLIAVLTDIGQVNLMKITARPSAPSYTDPVVWTKSVASLAIPISTDAKGPSGIASPIFHMMDEFISRPGYEGHLGQEALHHRGNFPPHWRALLEAIGQVSVRDFIMKLQDDDPCRTLWASLCESYRGEDGILGRHRRKVFAFLSIAFRLGRGGTIGGIKGRAADEPWMKVHTVLEKARRERYRVFGESHEDGACNEVTGLQSRQRLIHVSEVLSHTCQSEGYWFSAFGKVYNATAYRLVHPGGDKIIATSSGRDVSADLQVVNHFSGDASIAAKLQRYAIGRLHTCHFPKSASLQKLYDFTVALGYRSADCQATWSTHMTFLTGSLSQSYPAEQMTMQKACQFQRAWASLRKVDAVDLSLHTKAVLEVMAESLPDRQNCKRVSDTIRRLEAVVAGRFQRPAYEVVPAKLTMSQALEMKNEAASKLHRCRKHVISALKVFERSVSCQPEEVRVEDVSAELCGIAALLETFGESETHY